MSHSTLPVGFLDELWSSEVSSETTSFLLKSLLAFNDLTLTPEQHQAQINNQKKSASKQLVNQTSSNSTGPQNSSDVEALQGFIFGSLPTNIGFTPHWSAPQSQSTLLALILNNRLPHLKQLRLQISPGLGDGVGIDYRKLNNKRYSILTSFEKMTSLDSLEIDIEPDTNLSPTPNQQNDGTDPMTQCLQSVFVDPGATRKSNLLKLPHLKSLALTAPPNTFFSDLTPLTSNTSFPFLVSFSVPTIDLGLNKTALHEFVVWVDALTHLAHFKLEHHYRHTRAVKNPFLVYSKNALDVFATSQLHQYITALTLSYSDSVYPGSSLWALVHSPWFTKTGKLTYLKIATNKFGDEYTKTTPSPPPPSNIPTPSQFLSHMRFVTGLTNLQELRLVGLEITPWAIRDMTASWFLLKLVALEMTNIRKLDPICLPMIAGPTSTFYNIKELTLVNCGNEAMMGVASLATARGVANLEKVTLSYHTLPPHPHQPQDPNRVEDIVTFLTSPQLVNLKELTFERSNLSQKVIDAIAAAPLLIHNLRHFGFRNSTHNPNLVSTLFNNSSGPPPASFLANYYIDGVEFDTKGLKLPDTTSKSSSQRLSFGSQLTSLDLTGSTTPETYYHLAQSAHLGKIERLLIDGDAFRVKKFVAVALHAAQGSHRQTKVAPPLSKLTSPYLRVNTDSNITFNTARIGRGGSLIGYPTITSIDFGLSQDSNAQKSKQTPNAEIASLLRYPALTTNLQLIALHPNLIQSSVDTVAEYGLFRGAIVPTRQVTLPQPTASTKAHHQKSAVSKTISFVKSIMICIVILMTLMITAWVGLKSSGSSLNLNKGLVDGVKSLWGPRVVSALKLDQ